MKQENKDKLNEVRITVRESEPVLKKVEMLNGGRDGLKVTYHVAMVRNNVLSGVDISRKEKRPVQRELRVYFDNLKEHLLNTTGYYYGNETVKEMLLGSVSVDSMQTDEKGRFSLGGSRMVNTYNVNIKGPDMVNEDYDNFSELEEILNKIKAEAKLFMSGVKGADSKLVVLDYLITKKDMPDAENEFENMTREEQDKWTREAFDSYGLEIIEENGELVVGLSDGGDSINEYDSDFGENDTTSKESVEELKATPLKGQLEEETPFEDDFEIPVMTDNEEGWSKPKEVAATAKKPSKKK